MTMKNFYLIAMVMLLFLAGCSEDDQFGQAGEVPVSLTFMMAGNDAAVTRAGTDIQSTQFNSGETFYVYFPTDVRVGSTSSNSSTTFTTTNASGSASPATTPYFNVGASGASVYAYYPYMSGKQMTESTTSFSVELDQSTDANYKKSDLMYATANLMKSGSSATATLKFQHKMAKIMVTVNKGLGIDKIQTVRIVGGYRTVTFDDPIRCDYPPYGGLSDANSSNPITMWSGSSTSTVNCAALIPAQSISGNFLQIVTDKGTVTYAISSSKYLAHGQSYHLTATVSLPAIGNTIEISGWTDSNAVTVNSGDSNLPSGVMAVDLGLPSGTLWANMNVGATTETEFGSYYCWGDIAESGVNDYYIWFDTANTLIKKYCSSDNEGYWCDSSIPVDGKTVLDFADDAAFVHWGSDWRMPTPAQWQELMNSNYCTWTWTTRNNVKGYLVTSKVSGYTNNSIFLPAAWERYGSGYYYSQYEESGCYWSSSVHISRPVCADYLEFSSSGKNFSYIDRNYGLTVRAVYRPNPEGLEAVDLGLSVKWANMNVGASEPTGRGIYFGWGETLENNEYYKQSDSYNGFQGKDVYVSESYTWVINTNKYTSKSLEIVDDAARSCLKGTWRMPTQTELQELVDTKSNTTNYTWTWYDGSSNKFNGSSMAGWKIQSKKSGTSGNYIFIPAAGYRSGTGIYNSNSVCGCWSSTLYNSANAYYMGLSSSSASVSNIVKYYGLPVRAVQN